jgi:adenosine kinase
MKILVSGSVAYDLLLTYDGSFADAIEAADLKDLSVAFVTPRFARHHGGTGANIAWNLRLLNQEPLLVSTVGDDGGAYTALLEERGIATKHIERIKQSMTPTAIIATDSREHQITFYHPGADSRGTWPDLAEERDDLRYAIVSPRDTAVMSKAAAWCDEYRVPYIFDPGQQVLAFAEGELRKAVAGSSGVIANAYEWSLLSDRLHMSADDILEHAEFLIVTHGEEGATLYTRGRSDVVPACAPEKVLNPTGAGDAFRAGVLTGLSAGWSLLESARLGASLASFVVEIEGTLLDTIDLNDVLGRAEVTYGEMLPELP